MPAEVWMVTQRLRDGLMPEKSSMTICLSKEEADAIVREHPVGSETNDDVSDLLSLLPKDQVQAFIHRGAQFLSAGDADLYLPWKVLRNAEVSTPNGLQPSQKVLDYLGKERVDELKERFGDNWSAAGEFEYCWQETSHSSAAFIAAQCNYHAFISGDDFAAGYLLRDLEVLVNGVEAAATSVIEMRKKAGVAGSKKSAKSRELRRTALLKAMEDVARRNPDLVKLGEATLVKLALSQSSEAEPILWRQGKGQVMEYVGEIRRGEAGETMQTRYQSLFGN